MKKDAYFFPHFCNARHDRKIKRVIKDFGIEGYAMYFMCLEVLREQQDFKYPMKDIDLLADEFNTSQVKLEGLIKEYDLFDFDASNNFFSIKQIFYLQPYIEKTERAREAANIRWKKVKKDQLEYKNDVNAMQMHNKCNAVVMQGEERIGENKKGEDSIEEAVIVETEKINYKEILNYWNSKGYAPIKVISEQRKQKLKTRISEIGIEQFKLAIDKITASNFCKGENNKNWKASFDWLIQNDTNIIKVLEGKYDNKEKFSSNTEKGAYLNKEVRMF
jgi:hypothetical protein